MRPHMPRVVDEIAHRALVQVVVLRHFLQAPEQRGRIQVGPVGQQHDMLAVKVVGRGFQRIDDQCAVKPSLFLVQRMAVVPVGAGLAHLELVVVMLARVDAVEADAGHAIHVGRQQDAVPMH